MGRAPNLIPGIAEKHVKAKVHNVYQKDPHRVRSMTIKVDNDRYQRINKARYQYEMSGQEIFTEALDMWFKAKHI